MIAKVFFGDSRNMGDIDDEIVHLVVTSPPYWQIKDYGSENQIGFNQDYSDYINSLNMVWEECHRVLHKGCRLCVNIGEQATQSAVYGRHKIMPIRDDIVVSCEKIGFDFLGAVIWRKISSCSVGGGPMGSYPYPRNGLIKLDYEYILIFKKLGEAPIVSDDIKERSKLTLDEWNKYFTGHWEFPGVKQDEHQAMFPYELPKRLIKMYSFIDDLVLDPFLGSGTTMQAGLDLCRNVVGYEINDDFKDVINNKVGVIFGVDFLKSNKGFSDIDFSELNVKFSRRDNIFRKNIRDIRGLKKSESRLLDIQGDAF